MLFWETIRVAMSALTANKGRALLTMLGIIIGVAAVIAMMAIGEGASKSVQDRITSLGVNLLYVRPLYSRHRAVASSFVPLTSDDASALSNEMTLADAIVPEMSRSFQVKYRNRNTTANVIATEPDYFPVRRFELVHGRFFTQAEVEGRRRVAVLGADAVEGLGGGPSMVGEQIRIQGHAFEVVGVLEGKGAQGRHNPDNAAIIPLKTGQHRLMGTDRLGSITVQVASQDKMNAAASEIERVLRRRHKLGPNTDNDFQVRNQLDIMETFAETSRTFTFLLAGIAAVSLVVGGIGIMNIMLVSVTERTREIGVRMAIGAQRRVILLQFVLESVMLCIVGGALGILLGVGIASALATTGGWSVIVSTDSIALAVGFSVGIGLFFGIYPASRAAKLDPIEALRYE